MEKLVTVKILKICILVFLVGVLGSCQNQSSQKEQDVPLDATVFEEDWLPPMQVPYRILERYFVRNDVQDIGDLTFESRGQFERVFSPAATMGEGGRPTDLYFDREFVIAVISPETNVATSMKAVSLQRLADGSLLFTYKIIKGEQQSFRIRPVLAVVVEKQFGGKVIFREEQ